MTFRQRTLALLATLVVGLGLGTGFAQTELTYWDYYVTQGPAVEAGIALFEEQNPDITINRTLVATSAYDEALNLAMQSGQGPDVFYIRDQFLDFVDQGYLYDLSSFNDADAFKATFPTPEANFVEGKNIIDGVLYTAPFGGPDFPWLQLYINADLYEQAGLVNEDGSLKLPVTWEDFVNNSRIVAQNTDAYGAGFSMQQTWAAAWWYRVCNYSGQPYDAPGPLASFEVRTGEFTFASNPCYKTVLGGLRQMIVDGVMHPATVNLAVDDEGARALFAEGAFAHLLGGVWIMSGWEQTHPDFNNYVATHIPFTDGSSPKSYFGSGLGGTGYVINADTEHAEAAWRFFKFLHSADFARIWAEEGNGLLLLTPEPYEQYATNDAFAYVFSSTDMTRLTPQYSVRNPDLAKVQSTLIGASPEDVLVGYLAGQIDDLDGALADLDARLASALELGVADAQSAGLDVSMDDYLFPDWDPTQDYTEQLDEMNSTN